MTFSTVCVKIIADVLQVKAQKNTTVKFIRFILHTASVLRWAAMLNFLSRVIRLGNKQVTGANLPLLRSNMPWVLTQNSAQKYRPGAKKLCKTAINAPACDILISHLEGHFMKKKVKSKIVHLVKSCGFKEVFTIDRQILSHTQRNSDFLHFWMKMMMVVLTSPESVKVS